MTEDKPMPQISAHPPDELATKDPSPDFLMTHTQPRQIWIGTNHYIETDERRATPGKVYLFPQLKQLSRVVDIIEADESTTEYQVEGSHDTVVVEHLYDLNGQPSVVEHKRVCEIQGRSYSPGTSYKGECELTIENQAEGILRYQIESPEALTMGDIPTIPFAPVREQDNDSMRDKLQTSIEDHR